MFFCPTLRSIYFFSTAQRDGWAWVYQGGIIREVSRGST